MPSEGGGERSGGLESAENRGARTAVIGGPRRLIARAVDLRAGELPALCVAFVYFFCLLSAYYVLRPVRDEMGIAGGVEHLQWLFTATFVAMLAAVPLYGWLVSTFARRRVIPVVYLFFIANLLLFALAFRLPEIQVATARVFFVWTSVFNLFAVSVFWTFMADTFTQAQGKRLFGAIAAGGTAGAMAGPGLTAALAVALAPAGLVLISAALLLCAVVCVLALSRLGFRRDAREIDRTPIGGTVFAGVTKLARSRYLTGIGIYIVFYTWTSTFLYFQQAEIIAGAFDDAGERTRVFALIDLSVNVLTLGLQLFVTGRLLARVGVRGGLLVLPAITAIGFAALASGPVLAVLAAFQSVRRASNYAIARPAREVLFTVVSREERYKSKSVLDTVVYRGGDALTGWLYAGLAGLGLTLSALAAVAVPLAVIWLAVGWYLGSQGDARMRANAEESR